MMFLKRALEALLAGGVMVAAVSVWRLCSTSSSRSWRAAAWVVAAFATFGIAGFCWTAALKVSLRTALAGGASPKTASPLLQAAIVSGIIVLAGGWVVSFIRLGIPRFRAGSTSNLKYEAVSLTLCVALLVTSLNLPVQNQRLLTPAQRISELDRSLRALADGDREMPRDTWDPDYVLNMVGRDPQRLFRWVQQNTYWIPYRGVLRGPMGVLMDRQGNSLDRSILLATLLERAGYTVRLAHGDLEYQQALGLLPRLVADRMLAFVPQQQAATQDSGIQQISAQYQVDSAAVNDTLQAQSQTISQISAELHERVTDQTDRLLRAIDRPNEMEVWARTYSAALAALSDHWWAQRQDGLNWVDLDLLADRSKESTALVPASQTIAVKDLPAEMHHEITLRVIAEKWEGRKLSEYKALEQSLRPADLVGQSILLQFWPTEWTVNPKPASTADWKKEILELKEWDAVLYVGGKVATATLLAECGENPAERKGGDFGGLAASFSNSINLTPQAGKKTLSAVWLEYEIRVPGEKHRIVRRTVFDLLGPALRATSSPPLDLSENDRVARSLALTMQTEFLPIVCGFAPEFVTHLVSQTLLANRDLFSFLLSGKMPGGIASVDLLNRSLPPLSPLYTIALARTQWGRQDEVFVDRLNLFTRHMYGVLTSDGAALRDAIDIVANEVGVSSAVSDGFAARLSQGVLDTNAESLLRRPAVTFGNAGDAFASVRGWTGITPDRNPAATVSKLNLPADVREQIKSDLAAGYAVVAPDAAVPMQRKPFAGWWRIDSIGNAVGLGESGWGQDMSEESTWYSRVAEVAKRWNLMGRAVTFVVTAAQDYGWCVVPLIGKYTEDVRGNLAESGIKSAQNGNPNPVLGASLAIWEGAVKPSWHDCGGNALFVGGVTALLLPTRILRLGAAAPASRRLGRPKAPPEPPKTKPPCDEPTGSTQMPKPQPPRQRSSPYTYGREEWLPGDRDPELPAPKPMNTNPNTGSAIDSGMEWGRFPYKQGYVEYKAAEAVVYKMEAEAAAEQAAARLDAAAKATAQAFQDYQALMDRSMSKVQATNGEAGRLAQARAELDAAERAAAKADFKLENARNSDAMWQRLKPVNQRAIDKFNRMIEARNQYESATGNSCFGPETADSALGKKYLAAYRDFEDYYSDWRQAASDYSEPYQLPQSGQTQPVNGTPSPSGAPPGNSPPNFTPSGPGQTQPLSPGGPPPTSPAGNQTMALSPAGPPPGTGPPGTVDPYAKTEVGLSSVANALGTR